MNDQHKTIEQQAKDAMYEKTYKPSCGKCDTCTKGIISDKRESKIIQITK